MPAVAQDETGTLGGSQQFHAERIVAVPEPDMGFPLVIPVENPHPVPEKVLVNVGRGRNKG